MAKDIILETKKPASAVRKPREISLNDFMNHGQRGLMNHGSKLYPDDSFGGINWRVPKSYGEVFSSDIDVGDKVFAFNPTRGKYGRGVIMNIMWEGFSHSWTYNVQFEGSNDDTWTNRVNKSVTF